jgi:hypothetical protein
MRDFKTAPPDIEEKAKTIDPEAWRSSDSAGEAFDLQRRRYYARELAGWPNDRFPGRWRSQTPWRKRKK